MNVQEVPYRHSRLLFWKIMLYFHEEVISVAECACLDRNACTSLHLLKCINNICCLLDCLGIPYWLWGRCRFQMPRGLRRESAAARLLGLWVRIPPGGIDVCFFWMLCVVSTGLRHRPITRPEESYRVWYVCVWSWNVDNEEGLLCQGVGGGGYEGVENISV